MRLAPNRVPDADGLYLVTRSGPPVEEGGDLRDGYPGGGTGRLVRHPVAGGRGRATWALRRRRRVRPPLARGRQRGGAAPSQHDGDRAGARRGAGPPVDTG